MQFGDFDLTYFVTMMVALIICVTIHEFAHAYSAYRSGDETPKAHGRISLNPLDHLDPIGTVMMVVSSISGFGIGWGKPVQVNPANFTHPRWDNLRVSLWGPLSNILTAVVTGTALRFLWQVMPVNVYDFLWLITAISLGLAVFNLIPISPLDGSHILSSLLPYELARRYDRFMGQYGMALFLCLVLLPGKPLSMIIRPPRDLLLRLLTGA